MQQQNKQQNFGRKIGHLRSHNAEKNTSAGPSQGAGPNLMKSVKSALNRPCLWT